MATLGKAAAKRAVSWAAEALGITDWSFDLVMSDDPPEWAVNIGRPDNPAAIQAAVQEKHADVWLSISRSALLLTDPIENLFHEVIHVALHDVGYRMEKQDEPAEFFIDRVSAMMRKLYKP